MFNQLYYYLFYTSIGTYLFYGIIILILFFFFRKKAVKSATGTAHFMPGHFSAKEFFDKVEEQVKAYNMPDVQFARITHPERYLLPMRREYLRIRRKGSIIDICAAPFGTDSFVSYWIGEKKNRLKALANLLVDRFSDNESVHTLKDTVTKTRYYYDTDAIFRYIVIDCFNKVTSEMAVEDKGIRLAPEMAN